MTKRLFNGAVAAFAIITMVSPLSAVRAESETVSDIDVWGQLIELSSTDLPTTIVLRVDPAGTWTDYTVDIDAGTEFGTNREHVTAMADWITGDWLRVKGELNENTGVVDADLVVNTSIDLSRHRGLNGWITDIGDGTMTVQWNGVKHEVDVTSDTRLVVPPVNPASLSDFQVGDRVRVRMERNSDDAAIIVALRRGDHIYLKARTRGFFAELDDVNLNGSDAGTLEVTLLANPHLRRGDVNNLVGNEGDELVVSYDEDTRIVRRFNGETTADQLVEGDTLFIVGRVNDDGTVSARLVKDADIWTKDVLRHAGEVTDIDLDDREITVEPVNAADDDAEKVVIKYDEETYFKKHGMNVDDNDVEIGDVIHVRGTAHKAGDILTIIDVEAVVIVEAEDEDEDLPNLKVTDIGLSGNVLEISLENDGDADVNEIVSVYVWIDGELEWTYSSSTLADQDFLDAGGESVLSPQTIDGEAEVRACVDYGDAVEESYERDNCRTETVGS